MTDRLTLTRALESSGMQSAAAERIATEIYDAIHDNVATKQDLERIVATLKADLFPYPAADHREAKHQEPQITSG